MRNGGVTIMIEASNFRPDAPAETALGIVKPKNTRQQRYPVWALSTDNVKQCLSSAAAMQVTTVQHKQMFVPNQQLPSPGVAMLDGAGQFAAAPPGGFLGSKRAGAMQQAVSRFV